MTLRFLESALRQASAALKSTPVLGSVAELSDEDLGRLLLQRRFVSLAFTPFYDMVIDGLQGPRARLVCRQVLREEYPDAAGNGPSHHELLSADLVAIGLDRNAVLLSRPTPTTLRSITASFELVWSAVRAQYSEPALICTAACYAEYLVGVEYGALKPRIDRALGAHESVFYGPHLLHDSGHFKRLLEEVALSLDESDADQVRSCTDAVERCLAVKLDFYAQFGT